jgi:hypothetical protein
MDKYIKSLKLRAISNIESPVEDKENYTQEEIKLLYDKYIRDVQKWWREKYNLCITDKRYTDMTTEDILIEYYEDHFSNPTYADEKIALQAGYGTIEDMQEAEARRDMGDEYSEIVGADKKIDSENMEVVEDFKKEENK